MLSHFITLAKEKGYPSQWQIGYSTTMSLNRLTTSITPEHNPYCCWIKRNKDAPPFVIFLRQWIKNWIPGRQDQHWKQIIACNSHLKPWKHNLTVLILPKTNLTTAEKCKSQFNKNTSNNFHCINDEGVKK